MSEKTRLFHSEMV